MLFISGYVLHAFPFLAEAGRPIVVDLYDPFIIENLHFHANKPLEARTWIHRNDLAVLNAQLQVGDFFLCASDKQRDFWLGALIANNRANPQTWDQDRALRDLIDIVPFGMRSRPPRARGPGLKGVREGIAADDQLILWGGGIWEWLDPLTAIRAMPKVVARCPRARLFFIGIRHPSESFPASRMAARAVALSQELGLLDRCVFFNEWTPYAERETYLLEADIGISLHHDHLETRFAFRTRLLDYIWAGLPMVISGGDALGEVVAEEDLGIVTDCGDVDGVAEALIALLSSADAKAVRAEAFARASARYAWERVAEPLVAFCHDPRFAADKRPDGKAGAGIARAPEATPLYRLPLKAWRLLKQGGPTRLWEEMRSYVHWALSRG